LAPTAFQKGKLKIAAHVREELDRAGIKADSIRCRSGGTYTHRDTVIVIVTVDETSAYVDFETDEVEQCEVIVAGDVWRKIARFIDRLRQPAPEHR
jgi:hypothetical protein